MSQIQYANVTQNRSDGTKDSWYTTNYSKPSKPPMSSSSSSLIAKRSNGGSCGTQSTVEAIDLLRAHAVQPRATANDILRPHLLAELFDHLFGGCSLGFIDNQGAHSALVLLLDCIAFLHVVNGKNSHEEQPEETVTARTATRS